MFPIQATQKVSWSSNAPQSPFCACVCACARVPVVFNKKTTTNLCFYWIIGQKQVLNDSTVASLCLKNQGDAHTHTGHTHTHTQRGDTGQTRAHTHTQTLDTADTHRRHTHSKIHIEKVHTTNTDSR